MTVTNWYSCWCVVPAYTSHQLHNNKILRALRGVLGFFYLLVQISDNSCKPSIQKVRHTTRKILIAKSCFEIQENQLAVDFMINVLHSMWNLDRNSLRASERQCSFSFDLPFTFFFFSVSCLPQNFDVRMPSFICHYWIRALRCVNDAAVDC